MIIPIALNFIVFVCLGIIIISFANQQTLFWFVNDLQAFVSLILLAIAVTQLVAHEKTFVPYMIYGISIPITIVALLFVGLINKGFKKL